MLFNIYFSAKGTTQKCADYISGIVDPDTVSQNLLNITAQNHMELAANDVLLLSMPVYGGYIPHHCIDMIKQIKGENTPAIILAVFGNRHFDNALIQMQDLVEANGFKVIAAGAFLAEHSIFPSVATGRPDAEDYTFMKELNIFSSLTNLTMAREIRQGSKRLYHDLSSESDTISQELEHLEDHLTSAEDMEKAYRELENEKADQVHAKDETGTITALDIQSLKMIHAGLRIMQKMSRQNRFQIPFSVNGTWNVMNLSIIENSGEGPGIQADIHTLSYGTITTSLSFRENHFEGSYSADSREGLDFLQSNRVAIADGLDAISGSHTSEPTTSELYSMAKELVLLFKHIMQ